MDYRKPNMKFIKTDNAETAHKLRYEGFTEITEPGSKSFCFINDGKKLTFDTEKENCVYTNILNI